MRKALAFLLACFTGAASAAGAFDGIYQLPGTGEFWSVHQNGNQMIVGLFYSNPQSVLSYQLANGQVFKPPRLDNWDLFGGTMATANGIRVTGETAFGACTGIIDVTFGASSATIVLRSFANTAAANSQGINCSSLFQALLNKIGGNQYTVNRIF